jgi:DeoR/GlpR family transcriptional regulator of sugar metabolism
MQSARRLVVVADHTKWGVVGLSEIAPLDSVDTLVTDDRLEPEAQATLADSVREIILATPDLRPNGRNPQ